MIYNEITDELIGYFSVEKYKHDVVAAKKSFFEVAGIMDESRPDFELKMSQFVDWFLYSRQLSENNKRPIDLIFEVNDFEINEDQKELYTNLLAIRHSLFEFIKISKNDLYIKDIFSGYKHVIKDSSITVGFNKGELFEARLIPHKDSFVFATAFCFHPPGATKYILNQIKLLNKMKQISIEEREQKKAKLMLMFFQMKNKYDHYQHVALEKIYKS
jgi:hypothetical protein